MQHLFNLKNIPYFAFGNQQKTSLIAHYCLQNNYVHLKNPKLEQVKSIKQNIIIEGNIQLFKQLEKHLPDLQVIFFGNQFSNDQQKKIKKNYCSIGKCKRVPLLNQKAFRKQMYPNLIFFYGPNQQQNQAALNTLASNINYIPIFLPQKANTIISQFKKQINYTIDGFFKQQSQILVLEQYFNFYVIHFQYNQQDYPIYQQYFKIENQIISIIKNKSYYIKIIGTNDPVKIMDDIGIRLCPQLIYINKTQLKHNQYVDKYINNTDGLLLSIYDIQSINKQKNIPLIQTPTSKYYLLTSIIFKDFNRKQVILTDYPWHLFEFISFQNLNRKFKYFVDLINNQQYQYQTHFSSSIYYLQNQKRITPNLDSPLEFQLSKKLTYWIITGPQCVGKSTIAKYISTEYNYKIIQLQTYVPTLKQKLIAPQDGDQLPYKKIVKYFNQLLNNSTDDIYIFDGFSYEDKELELWINTIGVPNIINLRTDESQLIKRTRKKAQSDLTAQISEQQTLKAQQSLNKNNQWISKISQLAPQSKIYQIDYSMAIILAENIINSILKPRIYLVQRHQSLLYQNIAIKYNMQFINLYKYKLKDILPIIKNINKRDIILCYYHQDQQKFVSQDLYWIQKNIGFIRYLAIHQPQTKQIKEQYLQLERPIKQEKKKKIEGQQGQQNQQPPQQQQGQPKKKVLDIYQYQWTKPTNHKNLSQWFFKLKKSITQRNNNQKDCFKKFHQVINIINSNRQANVYQVIS